MPTDLEQARTLPVAAIGTALALATCTKPAATLEAPRPAWARGLRPGVDSQLDEPGLAVGLLLAGAV